MKLVYLANATIPSRAANTVHIMHMCQAFAQNGHDVLLVTRDSRSQDTPDADPFEFYGVEPCFSIEKLSVARGSIAFGWRAAKRAKKNNPDIVYGRFVPACLFSSLMGLNATWESHAPVRNFSAINRRLFATLVLSRLKKIVVISDALKQYYVQDCGIDESRILVAHDAATPAEPTEPLTFKNPGNIQVGYIGHLYPGKGMELIAQLVEKCPWAYFHIIGGTLQDIEYWKKKLQKPNNIKFYGFLPYSETIQYRQSFDVLLAPYQTKVYGHGAAKRRKSSAISIGQWMSPLKIFEYMSAKKPFIASDLPVLREVLTDGQNSLLCPPSNVESWKLALERLRDDSELANKLSETCYHDFTTKYTWQIRAQKVISDSGSESPRL
ncbi:MAG: glycosyltransferase family 4 protein [Phycisphaerae bacterium]|nr:glycosyltransferase family 4 protein [Phycisphaerae bacterium]